MNNYKFYDLLLRNFNLYIIILICSLLLYYFVFKKTVQSIIDPIFLQLFLSAFGFSTVVLMFATKAIHLDVFSNYIFTQIAYFSGFFWFKTSKKTFINLVISNEFEYLKQIKACFNFFFIILLIVQVFTYSTRGIPLFFGNRLEFYEGGSGFGVLSRVMEVSTIVCLYLFALLFFERKKHKLNSIYYVCILIVFIFQFFTGSKSALIVIPYVVFCFITYNNTNFNFHKYNWLKRMKSFSIFFAAIALVLAILVIAIQKTLGTNGVNPYLEFVIRLVHAGDIYWYAYPNNYFEQIDNNHWVQALFNDFFGLFRIYNWSSMPKAVGISLMQIHHPTRGTNGPNARHNVFGLIYFGYYGSILFSFILGLILSFIRHKLPTLKFHQFLGGIFYTFFYIKAVNLEVDPMLTFTYFNNIFFVFPIFFMLFLIFYQAFYKINFSNTNYT